MNIATVRMMSKVLFMPTDVTVLLPEKQKEDGEKYKVVWLLHGACGDHRTFLYSVPFDELLERHPAIIVIPSALNSDYGNYEQFGTGYNFATYFFEELMPFIYGTFPASSKREDNFIEGASMGGYGAFSLGLAHPEKFAAIGALGATLRASEFLQPYEDMDSREFRKIALADRKAFPTEYGNPDEGIKLKEINVITRYPTVREFLDSPECMWRRFPEAAASGMLPQIYVACGTEDLMYPAVSRMQKLVEELGVGDKVHFKLREGVGHSAEFFDAEIGCFLDFYEV